MTGIINGSRAGRLASRVLLSSLRGVTICESPEKAMRAVLPSFRIASRSCNFCFARVNLLGAMSVASIDMERSRMTTTSSLICTTGSGFFSHVGPESAINVSAIATNKAKLLRLPRTVLRSGMRCASNSGAMALDQSLFSSCLRLNIHASSGKASRPSKKSGRKKWKCVKNSVTTRHLFQNLIF